MPLSHPSACSPLPRAGEARDFAPPFAPSVAEQRAQARVPLCCTLPRAGECASEAAGEFSIPSPQPSPASGRGSASSCPPASCPYPNRLRAPLSRKRESERVKLSTGLIAYPTRLRAPLSRERERGRERGCRRVLDPLTPALSRNRQRERVKLSTGLIAYPTRLRAPISREARRSWTRLLRFVVRTSERTQESTVLPSPASGRGAGGEGPSLLSQHARMATAVGPVPLASVREARYGASEAAGE